jgi:hypothetical protein
MRDLILILMIFFLSICAHVLWCRLRPRKDLQIPEFLAVAFIGLLIFCLLKGKGVSAQAVNFWNMPLFLSSVVIYVLLVPMYLIFYFGTKVKSPSLQVLLILREKKELSEEDILKFLNDDVVLFPRLNDLERFGYLNRSGESYSLSPRGVALAKFLNFYQKLLGRTWGG